jgi:hypothetical protein
MLVKGAGRESSGTPRPYIPLGVVGVGLVVAYQAVTAYERLSPTDVALLFLFVFALGLFMGLRFFVVDRYDLSADFEPGPAQPVERQGVSGGVELEQGLEKPEGGTAGSGEERTT